MTVKQEQRLIAELRKALVAIDKVRDLANKLSAIGTASDMQLHAADIKFSIDFHTWHVGEVINGNIRD